MSFARPPASQPIKRPVINLALQGGGAHGAFTWGVLDCLLDRDDIDIGVVSGTSAGAVNGAALVSGLLRGGRAAAKEDLAQLWLKVAQAGAPMTFLSLPLRKPGMGVWDDAMPLLSPYQTNPFALEPLKYIINAVVDIEALRKPGNHCLFVNAVNVHTGYSRVFGPPDISTEAIAASACAPLMFQAARIENESYWDGSYAGNPMLWPLYEDSLDADIFMVELTPLYRAETPTTAKNILNRINEIASINGLVSEMRALESINRTTPGANLRMHVLSLPDDGMEAAIEPSIKRTVGMMLFESLRQSGYAAAQVWLDEHAGKLGVCSSVDVAQRYLAMYSPPAKPVTATH